ncbi:hypothetical protein, partial [Piscirickettsia litoralis]|uniref:hypothetical protein n=1 Tax=Piscirickettsia litoralis TaxID=1891921 RepID=UPI001914BE5A
MNLPLVWDAHGCFALRKTAELEQLSRYKEVGVNFLSINIGMDFNPLSEIIEIAAGFRKFIDDHADYALVTSYSSLEDAIEREQMAIAFDLEGTVML